MTGTNALRTVNRLPVPTWNWLKMNRATVSVETGSEIVREKKEIVAKEKDEKHILNMRFDDGKSYDCEQTIVAEENAEVTVILNYVSRADAKGFSSIKTNLVAKPHSKIHLIKVQLLGSGFVQIDDTVSECDENAFVEVTQIELGGSKVYAQVKNNLNGLRSKFKSDTAYLCMGDQFFDFNYLVNSYGKNSDAGMVVKGVVGDSGQKVYRGTIDFKNGCSGSVGSEQEETLLLSPSAVNKSIPIILCDEEDVSGTHGSTIGRLGSDELFYFQSRGISESEANKILSRAKIMSVANLIPDGDTVSMIKTFVGDESA